jgi:DNA polymerase, archaea type
VTAYGRKILNLMVEIVSSCDATVIEVDTDGIFFSHDEPKAVYDLVQDALPEGINIELELENCGLYAPKAKSYVIVHPSGKTTVKGLFRKRDRYPLERDFPVEFLRLYFTESPESATSYYNSVRDSISSRSIPIEQLTITRKIGAAEKNLVALGFGKAGDRVSFWYAEQQRVHGRSGATLKSIRAETQTEPYWIDHYLQHIDILYQSISGDDSLRLAELPLFQPREDAAA